MRRYEAQRIQPRWWRRLSCRYLCYAARNPPSDDSQRHKSLVSHLSGTFPSPSFRLPPSSSLSLCVSRTPPSTSRSSFLVFLSSFPLFSSISPLVSRSSIQPSPTGLSPLHLPCPRCSLLSFHGHGGVSQEHRSERNIDPSRALSASLRLPSQRSRSAAPPLVVHHEPKDVCAENLWALSEGYRSLQY